MRTNPTIPFLAAAVAWLWPAPAVAQKQIYPAPTTQMVTQTIGTVVEMDDRAIIVRSEESQFVRHPYRCTYATRWVNASGDSVSRQSVRPGATVTVHYRRDVDGKEASRVVLHSPPGMVGRNLVSDLALTVAALPPSQVAGAPPPVLGPQLPQIAEGTEPEPVAKASTVVKRRVARNPARYMPKPNQPPIVPKKRSWLATLFAPR
jgi:hypothetical protein